MLLGSILFALQWLTAEAYRGRPKDPDLPGHSDKWELKGSSGYGCQTRDSEIVLPRNPKRDGEDDGTLWTGETVFKINQRPAREINKLDKACSGIYRMPTVFWIGPSTQGSDGKDNRFGLGMITWETNDTDKSNAWHVYRPCLGTGTGKAFLFKGLVHYDSATTPPDDTTVGLNLVSAPRGNEISTSNSPLSISFNGVYNGVKEPDEYLGKSAIYLGGFSFIDDLNCTSSSSSVTDFGFLSHGSGEMRPGTTVNGSLSNDTILLRFVGSWESKILHGQETPTTTTVTNVTYMTTEFDIAFNGRYDMRNSSQRLVVNTSAGNVITFIASGTRLYPPPAFFSGILLFIFLYTQL
ncbi:hypothetical protein ACJ72_01267 [Emergomyces africanus]|uniref:Uncharacterized protein n=1 Tax=Emergomyces africanus TaxID=1955775 RepID=A0A1B7P5R3_9EURO|nr:hypothetical protein ACJ72_01267 [Emergomyces africanus]